MRNDVEKEQKSNVDIMKFILSIMVVCIHTGITSLMPAEIGKLFNSIFNLAVPIFFVYSGYFFSCEDKLIKKDKLVKYSKHIAKLYILWSAIYLPICIQIYMESGWSIQECLHNYSEGFFQLGQHPYSWQLWYLWSLIFICAILYIFELFKFGDKVEILLCFTMFLIFSIKSTSSEVYTSRIMYGNCAGICYFATGMLLRKINFKAKKLNTVITFFGVGTASTFLLTYYVVESHSILWNIGRIVTVGCIAFLSLNIPMIKIKRRFSLWLRNASEWIYLTHLVFLYLFDKYVDLGNFEMTCLIIFVEISLALFLYNSLSEKRGIFQILL